MSKKKVIKKSIVEKKINNEDLSLDVKKMVRRLELLDSFVSDLISLENDKDMTAEKIIEILLIKARHLAFTSCGENYHAALVYMINQLMYNAEFVFDVVMKDKKKKGKQCTSQQNGEQ